MRAEIHPKKEGGKAILALTSYLLGECGTKGGLTLAFLPNEKGAISDGGVGERLLLRFFGFGMASLCMQMWASPSSTLRFPPFSSSSRERTQMREGGGVAKGKKEQGGRPAAALCVADREKENLITRMPLSLFDINYSQQLLPPPPSLPVAPML